MNVKSSKKVISVLAALLSTIAVISCGGGGGNTSLQTPSADLTGTWLVQETETGDCPGSVYPQYETYNATVTQSGNNITIVNASTPANTTVSGTISGNVISWNISRPSGSGTTAIKFSGTVSSDGNTISGSASWTWSGSGTQLFGNDGRLRSAGHGFMGRHFSCASAICPGIPYRGLDRNGNDRMGRYVT